MENEVNSDKTKRNKKLKEKTPKEKTPKEKTDKTEKDKDNGKEKEKSKPKSKAKKTTKKEETSYAISDETIQLISKYKVNKVFINHSKIKDDNILIALLVHHNVLEYKCNYPKCKVKGEWCGNPIRLILERINNKQDDLRISNLQFVCHNCYFANNNSDYDKLFVKMKKKTVVECMFCNYNLCNMPLKYQQMKVCKMCIKINTEKRQNFNNKNLFMNTFSNSLTEDDINEKEENFNNINDMIDLSKNESLSPYIKPSSFTSSSSSSKIKRNSFTKSESSQSSQSSQKSKNKKSKLINISMNDLNMEDIEMFKSMISDYNDDD